VKKTWKQRSIFEKITLSDLMVKFYEVDFAKPVVFSVKMNPYIEPAIDYNEL